VCWLLKKTKLNIHEKKKTLKSTLEKKKRKETERKRRKEKKNDERSERDITGEICNYVDGTIALLLRWPEPSAHTITVAGGEGAARAMWEKRLEPKCMLRQKEKKNEPSKPAAGLRRPKKKFHVCPSVVSRILRAYWFSDLFRCGIFHVSRRFFFAHMCTSSGSSRGLLRNPSTRCRALCCVVFFCVLLLNVS
jgi:hypothetical protein